MSWLYLNKPVIETPEQYQGFVYEIHDLYNNRFYIGKKNFWRTQKLKPLKGKTRRRYKRIESDWQSYYGSNKELQEQVSKLGPDHFQRKILVMCANKNQMNYFEIKYQIDFDVLFDTKYYNSFIGGKVSRRGLV